MPGFPIFCIGSIVSEANEGCHWSRGPTAPDRSPPQTKSSPTVQQLRHSQKSFKVGSLPRRERRSSTWSATSIPRPARSF